MAKHLFRVNFTNPRSELEEEVVKKSESFKVTDQFLSKHFLVHVFDAPFDAYVNDIFFYGRDCIVEWIDTLFVKTSLYRHPAFLHFMKDIGYNKYIFPSNLWSEGGRFVNGNNFIFLSCAYNKKKIAEVLSEHIKENNLHKVTCLTDVVSFHIDTDYQILDAAKIIYIKNLGIKNAQADLETARNTLKSIAKEYGYEVRDYSVICKPLLVSNADCRIVCGQKVYTLRFYDNTHLEQIKKANGINSIIDGNKLFTSYINAKEKEYLRKKGIHVFVVPVGLLSIGAGLRCVYGEFNI